MSESTVPAKGRTEQTTPESTRGGVFFTPRVDIVETDKELVVYADLPGVRPEDVDLRYERGELLLHGKVRPRSYGRLVLANEYDVGDFYRAFTIHENLDPSKIEAECKNGVLTVHLPKMEAARPRQIAVKSQ
jgi:HSP20 family protein